jgi:hypothetical protein
LFFSLLDMKGRFTGRDGATPVQSDCRRRRFLFASNS